MKYKFCSIRINVIKYDVTFATKGRFGYATALKNGCTLNSVAQVNRRYLTSSSRMCPPCM